MALRCRPSGAGRGVTAGGGGFTVQVEGWRLCGVGYRGTGRGVTAGGGGFAM